MNPSSTSALPAEAPPKKITRSTNAAPHAEILPGLTTPKRATRKGKEKQLLTTIGSASDTDNANPSAQLTTEDQSKTPSATPQPGSSASAEIASLRAEVAWLHQQLNRQVIPAPRTSQAPGSRKSNRRQRSRGRNGGLKPPAWTQVKSGMISRNTRNEPRRSRSVNSAPETGVPPPARNSNRNTVPLPTRLRPTVELGGGEPSQDGYPSDSSKGSSRNTRDSEPYPGSRHLPRRQHLSVKKSDPERLDDNTDPLFSAWKKLMIAKLRENYDHFPDEESRMAYVFDRTKGESQRHLDPRYLTDREDSFVDAEEMIAYLASVYENQQEIEDAQDEFEQMTMGINETFQEFRTRFLQKANLAGVPLSTRLHALYRKIIKELQWDLYLEKTQWTSFDQACERIGAADKTRRQLIARNGPRERTRDRMSTRARNSIPATNITPRSTPRTPGLFDVRQSTPAPSRETPRRSIPQAPLTCWNCGKLGHTSPECSEPKKVRINEMEEGESHSESDETTESEPGNEQP